MALKWKCPDCGKENTEEQMYSMEGVGTVFECVFCASLFSGYLAMFESSDMQAVGNPPTVTVEVRHGDVN